MLAIDDNILELRSNVAQPQDVHISCPLDLVELLVKEFEQQFTDNPNVGIYDYGRSDRFHAGYIVLAWKNYVNPTFEHQLDSDTRLLGYSIYNLAESLTEPGPVVSDKKLNKRI